MNNRMTIFRKPTTLIFLAAIVIVAILLSMLITGYLRTKSDMLALMEQESMLLIHSLELAFQNTMLANMELEKLMTERLFDIAMMVDRELLAGKSISHETLKAIAEQHQVHRIFLVDNTGKKLVSSFKRSEELSSQPAAPDVFEPAYTGKQQRVTRGFREHPLYDRTTFGVAFARSDTLGAIVLSADAGYVLQFKEKVGLSTLFSELVTTEQGIAYIGFCDPTGNILYSNVPQGYSIPPLQEVSQAFEHKETRTQIIRSENITIFDVIEPFYFDGELFGFFRIGLEMRWLNRLVTSIRTRMIAQGFVFFLVGAISIGFVIVYQKRALLLREYNIRLERLVQERTAELVTTNQQLKEANASKDKFFSIIAHDLRSPFNALIGFTHLIIEKIERYSKEEIREKVNRLKCSAETLYALLENLLAWSRLQRGAMEHDPEHFDVVEVAEYNIDLFTSNAAQKQITLKSTVPEETLVYADYNMVNTTIRNLVSNALKFTDAGGIIEISAKPNGKVVSLSVSDTGAGIPEKDVPKLFRIDEKYTNPGTAGETGTGLGLILCKDLVERNGGEIQVESKIGKGTMFTFTLPKQAPAYENS